jgi:hypothetical protein
VGGLVAGTPRRYLPNVGGGAAGDPLDGYLAAEVRDVLEERPWRPVAVGATLEALCGDPAFLGGPGVVRASPRRPVTPRQLRDRRTQTDAAP